MSAMNQPPPGQPPGSYPQQPPYPNQLMGQRPPGLPPNMQWGQQPGVPPRYGMVPSGQMGYSTPAGQAQPGQPHTPLQSTGGPQGPYSRPIGPGQMSMGPGQMMRPPTHFPGQSPMGMQGMQPANYAPASTNRMMMGSNSNTPQQPHIPSASGQFIAGGVLSQGSQPQPGSTQFATHGFSGPGGADIDRNRGRPIAPLNSSHIGPGGMVTQNTPTQINPAGMGQSHQPPMNIQPSLAGVAHGKVSKKKKRLSDKLLTDRIQDIVPESQAYMELLQFEKKIDETIQRKRLEVQEVLKKPLKLRKKLRIFINSSFFPANIDAENPDDRTPSWELRVEGRLLDDPATGKVADPAKFRRKFSSFFKSLVIELDKNIYGPENYLVEWHRTATTQETDGFQVKRPGEQNVVCKLHFMLDYQPPQFKLDARLARLLGIHTQTRTAIIMALWQYIRTHRLQDPHERDVVICDKYLQQIFEVERIRFPDIPQAITGLLLPPEPIIVQHVVAVGPGEGQTDARRTSCYDIEVEVDDPLVGSMHQFIFNLQTQQEIAQLDSKVIETVELINKSKTAREFYSGFSNDPQAFIDKWLASQSADLKTMTDVEGNPEYDRRSGNFNSEDPSTREAIMRYFFNRVHQRRAELEQALMNGK